MLKKLWAAKRGEEEDMLAHQTHVTRCSLQLTHFKVFFSKHLSGKNEMLRV